MEGDGDCFSVAYSIVDLEGGDLVVCHGQPTFRGRGPMMGRRYWHAWVENRATDTVIDRSNGLSIEIDRSAYYDLGSINPTSVQRYVRSGARRFAIEYMHYGPWNDEFPPITEDGDDD